MCLSISNRIIKYVFDQGYRVLNNNIVNPKGKILSISIDSRGYPSITINTKKINGKRQFRRLYLHRLVAYQKYGEQIFGENVQVRHLDGNSYNFNPSNIAIGSQSENMMDRDPEERSKMASYAASFNIKYDDDTVRMIKNDRNNGMKYPLLCSKYHIAKSTLWYILNKR
jgi:hypothetical protein